MSFVLVVLERSGEKWHKMSWEALAAGQALARGLGLPVASAVLGKGIQTAAAEVPGKVYAVEHDLLEHYTADAFTAAAEQLIRQENPSHVVFPHTYQVRDFAPKLATRFGAALLSDLTGFRPEGHDTTFERQLFQGKLMARLTAKAAPAFLSIQAGAYRASEAQESHSEMVAFTPQLDVAKIRQKPEPPFRESARAVDLTAADIIVSVGRGIKEKDNIPLIEQLAQAMGGELAASRPICDNGWLPMERQVGSSGQTVAPKVYMAVGISGAIQHLVGMKGAKTIVAINKDPNAPIFEVADYGICGDLFEVVPALIEEVKKARS
jgi:electron transfer flavoprotein alpha subunit